MFIKMSRMLLRLLPLACLAGVLTTPAIGEQPNLTNELLWGGQVRSSGSYLGVRLVDIDDDRARALNLKDERGAEVTRVQADSPAERAGIRPGDVLLTYNGENIVGAQQLGRLVLETPAGRKVRVQLWRDGKVQTIVIVTGAPPSPGWPQLGTGLGMEPSESPPLLMPVVPNPLMTWSSSLLGIEYEQVDSQLADYFGVRRGMLVRSVVKGSAADKGGLKAGDVITQIAGRNIETVRDVNEFLRTECQVGKRVPVVVTRDRRKLTLSLVPTDTSE